MLKSFYIGDAAGREKTDKRKKDFATSDRNLAANIGIAFQTPEEFFLRAETEPYEHVFEPVEFLAAQEINVTTTSTTEPAFSKKHSQELIIFCGSPGAGKSTWYWTHLQPLGFARVNQDTLKSRDKCLKVARDYLAEGDSVAVDNTNADILDTRALDQGCTRFARFPFVSCVSQLLPDYASTTTRYEP